MGADQSNLAREREYAREVAERENLRHAREEELQEKLRLERRNLYLKSYEAQQLQEALRRSTAETHISHLYPSLNNTAGSSRSETYQTTAPTSLPVNHDHLRFQPSAPSAAPLDPSVRKPPETRLPPPRPCPPTFHKSAAPQATTVRASAAPQATTTRASAAPQATTARASAAPQATTARASAAPQSTTARASAAPQATSASALPTAPQATTVRASATTPEASTVRASATAPQATTVRASAIAPQATTARASAEASYVKKGATRKDDSTLCKTCKKPYEDKIFQCKNGHSSCEGCWSLDMPCGLCRGPITNIRNFDLENYFSANQRVKCPNAAEGCIITLKKSEMPKHEKLCPFKELKCPALGICNWKGKISQLSNHFDEEHQTSRQANVDTEMFLPIMCNEYISLQLIKLGNFNFLFYVKVSEIERKVYMDVQLIGTKSTASKWTYEIHVYNKREPRRKYQYNDTCRSSEETPTDISIRNCAVLPLPYAMSFVNEGTLTYKFFIKKNLREKRN